ncbi:MAG TPA: HAD family hydrolase [Pyrinomonadaceae bacterium]|nr:HAD family hydrolase [Pyrinomonadaceae bacterium]
MRLSRVSMQMKRPAVFIDRDGTISEEVGYINHPSRFRVFPYSAEAIRTLNDSGWLAIVITNQAGVARGYFPEEMIASVHDRLKSDLENAQLDAIYYCAHHPSVGEPPYRFDCDCRKPKTGLIDCAAKDFEIDLEASWMVGDRYSDVELARNAGLHSAFVLSGYGRGEWEYQRNAWKHQPDIVCENLLEAVNRITGFAG